MLEKMISSKSKVKILRKMMEDENREFCLEDLVRTTNLSFGTVYPALKDLVDSRIVITRKPGRSKLYKINRKHFLYRELKNLFKKEKSAFMNIAKKFAEKLKKEGIKNIILFGSVARGDFTGKSDVDVLIIYEKPDVRKRVERLCQEFLDRYDVEMSPTFLSVEEARERRARLDRFLVRVLDEGKVLYGDAEWLER